MVVFTHDPKSKQYTAENVQRVGTEPDSCDLRKVMFDWRDDLFSVIRVL
jgi:hypothetical protein